MKHEKDRFTAELPLPGGVRPRGRPAKPDALTPAERAKAYRQRKKVSAPVALPEEKTYTQADYEQVCKSMRHYRDSMWAMESTINGLQKEQALLIEERGKLFSEVERLKAELARKS